MARRKGARRARGAILLGACRESGRRSSRLTMLTMAGLGASMGAEPGSNLMAAAGRDDGGRSLAVASASGKGTARHPSSFSPGSDHPRTQLLQQLSRLLR